MRPPASELNRYLSDSLTALESIIIPHMVSRLWHMNADFEVELAATGGPYRRPLSSELLNHRLAEHLLWLANPGDALLIQWPWSERLQSEARRRVVGLIRPPGSGEERNRLFTPWGWSPSAVAAGEKACSVVRAPRLDVVARVNSKLWSHALEVELGMALPGAALTRTFDELREAVARASPGPDDKWVVKSPYGFAARERVLGRGSVLEEPQAKWARRRLAAGETLIFQPWLDVVREYGVALEIAPDGSFEIRGVSDLQTNGAGAATGYILGRPPGSQRLAELERVARLVASRLFDEGYYGPVGIDALEHAGGLHPLLEINARYTMGFVAVAVERSLQPSAPTFWSFRTKSAPEP